MTMNRSAYRDPASAGDSSSISHWSATSKSSQSHPYQFKQHGNDVADDDNYDQPSISLCSTTVRSSHISTRTTTLYQDDPYSRITLNDDIQHEYDGHEHDDDGIDIDLDSDFDSHMSMDDEDDDETAHTLHDASEPFYHLLPPELLDQILLFLTPHDLSTSLTRVNRYMHQYIEQRDELWHQHLIQLSINQRWDLYMTSMPTSIIPSLDSLHECQQRSYAELYRVLCRYGTFIGHWYSSSMNATGAMFDVCYHSADNHIYMTQVDFSRPHERSRVIAVYICWHAIQ